MNNEDKFRNKLKSLLDEPYYAYDADNWDKASEHLDAEDKKKRRGFFFFLWSGLGVVVLLSGYFLIQPLLKTSEHTISAVPPISSVAKEGTSFTAMASETPSAPNVNPVSPGKPTGSGKQALTAPAKLIEEPETPSFPQASSAPSSIASTKKSLVKTTSGSNAFSSSPATALVYPPKEKKQPVKNETKKDEAHANTINPETPVPSTVDAQQPEAGQETPQALALANPMIATEPPPSENKTTEDEVPPLPHADSSIAKLPPGKTPDTVAARAATVAPEALPRTNYCFAEAGAFFNLGWKYRQGTEGRSLNPYLGLSYMMWLTDDISVSAGAYYTTLSQFKHSKEIRASKVVFGEEADVTAITPLRLNYIAIPLRLYYSLGKKQMFSVGYSAGYLLDVQSRVDKHSEKLDQKQNPTSYRTGGYVEGFKTFNSQLSVGYRRVLKGNLSVNGEVFLGLTDLRDNTFFGIQLKERATGLKLSLTYDLIKK